MRVAWRFTPRPVPTLAAAALIALTLSLSAWQARRMEEKQERQATLEARAREPVLDLTGGIADADAVVYRRVRVRGTFMADQQLFVDNRQHAGRAGFHVVTPLRIEGSEAPVLVNRGWVVRTREYPAPPVAPVPAGITTVEGLATMPPARVLELSADTVSGNVWQNLSIAKVAARSRLALLPVVVLASTPGPGMAAVEEKPSAGVEKHQEYALTWLALAVTTLVLWIVLNLKREAR